MKRELFMLLAVFMLVCPARGAMAQVPEISTPILSSGLHDAAPVRTQAIKKPEQPPVTEAPLETGNLPRIESIGPGSDIRPFLAFGVSEDLTRAALRRAWLSDPAIRDFIGLSENSWDFNAPGGASGFGSPTALTGEFPAGLRQNAR